MDAFSRTNLPSDAEIFNFTKRRFVGNEEHELSQSQRTFNVIELTRHAAPVVQANRCVSYRWILASIVFMPHWTSVS
jgi:hypothetical protein